MQRQIVSRRDAEQENADMVGRTQHYSKHGTAHGVCLLLFGGGYVRAGNRLKLGLDVPANLRRVF